MKTLTLLSIFAILFTRTCIALSPSIRQDQILLSVNDKPATHDGRPNEAINSGDISTLDLCLRACWPEPHDCPGGWYSERFVSLGFDVVYDISGLYSDTTFGIRALVMLLVGLVVKLLGRDPRWVTRGYDPGTVRRTPRCFLSSGSLKVYLPWKDVVYWKFDRPPAR